MQTVRSKDGTTIAYDQLGQGKPLILVAGAFSFREYVGSMQLANLLSPHFTVINYDRRGRGDSTDTKPYAVEREIEDLDALIRQVGGSAYVWGLSSGAVLALKAAAAGLNITRLSVYEPPFIVNPDDYQPPADFIQHVSDLIAADRRGEAVHYFMTKGMGAPSFFIRMMRFMPGVWKRLKAVAHTLPYDAILLQGLASGKPLVAQQWASITIPTQVMNGEKSAPSLRHAAEALAKILPNVQYRVLEGQSHNVSMEVLAPVLTEYFNS